MIKYKFIQSSKEILGGTPVFVGTRVPVQTLIDYLEEGKTVDEFLLDFPTVNRESATGILEQFKKSFLKECYESAA